MKSRHLTRIGSTVILTASCNAVIITITAIFLQLSIVANVQFCRMMDDILELRGVSP